MIRAAAQTRDRGGGESGFTLVELMVVLVVAIPILAAVLSTSAVVRSEIQTSDTVASSAESCRIAGQRLALLSRSGLVSTCEVRAIQADVDAATAAHAVDPSVVIPSLGDWIPMPAGASHPTLRFQSADGVLSMNSAALTPARALEFVIEPGETANGADDDGDGLVDEGKLQLTVGSVATDMILAGVETCSFTMNGRVLRIQLGCARGDRLGRIHRTTATFDVFMRNS
ncbi:MAG: prepilin-type N-terminal cleavage/methylation domain-containing protein [Planctomycetes bacterium]|nr:prepilin-type N-terminal cleavage/methylation domain-containing protein [Planctomycetota bacterium]